MSHEAGLEFWRQTYFLLLHILIYCNFLFDIRYANYSGKKNLTIESYVLFAYQINEKEK